MGALFNRYKRSLPLFKRKFTVSVLWLYHTRLALYVFGDLTLKPYSDVRRPRSLKGAVIDESKRVSLALDPLKASDKERRIRLYFLDGIELRIRIFKS